MRNIGPQQHNINPKYEKLKGKLKHIPGRLHSSFLDWETGYKWKLRKKLQIRLIHQLLNERVSMSWAHLEESLLFLFTSDGTDIKDETSETDCWSFGSFFPSLSISVSRGNMEAAWPRMIYKDFSFFPLPQLNDWYVVQPPSWAIRPPSTSPCGEREIREIWKWRGRKGGERDVTISTGRPLLLSLPPLSLISRQA